MLASSKMTSIPHTIDVDIVCHSEPSTCSLDPIDYLPNEILWKIIGCLSVEDLCHLAVCSKAWRNVTNINSLWLHLCKLRDWERFCTEVDLRKEKPIHSTGTSTSVYGTCPTFQADSVITGDCNLKDLTPTCEWKEVYMRAWHLDRNWSEGRYHEHSLVLSDSGSDFNNATTRCVASDGTIFGAGDTLGYVGLWELNSGRFLQKIQPSKYIPLPRTSYNEIEAMTMKDNIGVAAFMGGILVFEASTGNVLKLIRGTANDFDRYKPSGLYMEEDKVIVSYRHYRKADNDEGIPVHIWDISGLVEDGDNVACTETKLCTDSLNVSIGKHMKCFACHGHWVITSFEDETAFILWDTRTSHHVRIYRGHTGQVRSGRLDENTILTGDVVGEIRVWTTESDVCIKTLSTNPRFVIQRVLFNEQGIAAVVFTPYEDKQDLVFWSRDGSLLNKHKSKVNSYKFHGKRLVTLDLYRDQVSVWEVSTGKCLLNDKELSPEPRNLVHIDDTKIVFHYYQSRLAFILQYW